MKMTGLNVGWVCPWCPGNYITHLDFGLGEVRCGRFSHLAWRGPSQANGVGGPWEVPDYPKVQAGPLMTHPVLPPGATFPVAKSADIERLAAQMDAMSRPRAFVDTKYPHKCPRCGAAAYVGLNVVDCKAGCS